MSVTESNEHVAVPDLHHIQAQTLWIASLKMAGCDPTVITNDDPQISYESEHSDTEADVLSLLRFELNIPNAWVQMSRAGLPLSILKLAVTL